VVRFLTGLVLMFAMLHEASLFLDAGYSESISGDGLPLGSPGPSPFLPTPVVVEGEDAGDSLGAALEGLFSALPLPPEDFLCQSPSPLFENPAGGRVVPRLAGLFSFAGSSPSGFDGSWFSWSFVLLLSGWRRY
jgi:hypothetical protein